MKKEMLLVIFFLVVANAGTAVDAQYIDTNYAGYSPNILVNLVKQEPDPVEPGKQVEITFKIDNNGTAANGFVFEVVPEYPFSLLPGESAANYIGALGSSQYGRYSVNVKYKLKVAQDAADGSYKIKVRYKNENMDSWATIDNLIIRVQSQYAIIGIEGISTSTAVTAPGQETKLTIALKNYATSLLKDIKVSLSLNKEGDEVRPFSPIGSANEKVISYIEPQATVSVEFNLLVDSDAVSKAYKVPLNVRYSDVLNNNYTKSNIIAIIVGQAPDLGVTLERTEVYTSGSTGSVVLRLVNQGPVGIKFLNVKVLQNENVKVIGADEVYVGKLDSDDFSTAEFKMFLKGKGSVKIPVEVTYKDTNNNDYKEKKDVKLELYSSSEAKNFGVKKDNQFIWIVVVIVALSGGYYYYRKRKKNKK